INFLNWLQAQGAVTQNAAMPGAPGTTGPVPVPMPPRQRPSSQPLDDSQYLQGPDMGTGPLPTGPLPPPTPEALKAMFAELEPETTTRRIVDADVVSAHDADDWNAERDDLAAGVPADLSEPSAGVMGGWGNDARADSIELPATGPLMPPAPESETSAWMPGDDRSGDAAPAIPAESATEDEDAPRYSAFSGFAPAQDDIPAESATDSGGAPTTLEALEQSFARSGFESYDMRPGELAAMAERMPATASGEQPPDLAGSGDAEEFALSPEPESRSVSQPAGPAPDPDDYAGRLNLARERRAAGNLDDALGEYRIILKNAPDLLGDVMDDLNESLDAAPDHPEIHRLLGDAHIRQGDYLSALEAYNRAVALTQAQGN
ncbi:MAG TPA: tetratricopeptide repeat protein, partial [Ktedonobacterales bacterium]|nr:tetratricopeptide repeat protein [Ktedonobacterales bacterium]